jgi:hypothetical protein
VSFNIGKLILAPNGKQLSEIATPAQNNMLEDWSQGRFQKSDISLARGLGAAGQDSINPFGKSPDFHTRLNSWMDNTAPSMHGDSRGLGPLPYDPNDPSTWNQTT